METLENKFDDISQLEIEVSQLKYDKKQNSKIKEYKEYVERFNAEIKKIEIEYDREIEEKQLKLLTLKREVAKEMANEGVKKLESDFMRATLKHRTFENINDYTFNDQAKIKKDNQAIEVCERISDDIVTVKKEINLTAVKQAIKDGLIIISNNQLISSDGELTGIKLTPKDEYEITTKLTTK